MSESQSIEREVCLGTQTLKEARGLPIQKTWFGFCYLASLFGGSCCYSHASEVSWQADLGQELFLTYRNTIEALWRDTTERWMSNTWVAHYPTLLLDKAPYLILQNFSINPDIILSDQNLTEPLHNYLKVADEVQSIRPNLTDAWLWDRSCLVQMVAVLYRIQSGMLGPTPCCHLVLDNVGPVSQPRDFSTKSWASDVNWDTLLGEGQSHCIHRLGYANVIALVLVCGPSLRKGESSPHPERKWKTNKQKPDIVHCKEHQKGNSPRGPRKQGSRLGHLEGSLRTSGASPDLGHFAWTQISPVTKLHTGKKNQVGKKERCQTRGRWMVVPALQDTHSPCCSQKTNGCQTPPGHPYRDI